MKIFTSLLTLSVYCLFLSTADAEISAKTPKQRCEVFHRINSNSATETDETDQKQLKAIYESNLKKHEEDKNNTFFMLNRIGHVRISMHKTLTLLIKSPVTALRLITV